MTINRIHKRPANQNLGNETLNNSVISTSSSSSTSPGAELPIYEDDDERFDLENHDKRRTIEYELMSKETDIKLSKTFPSHLDLHLQNYQPKDPISALLLTTTHTVHEILTGTVETILPFSSSSPDPSSSPLKGIPLILSAAVQAPLNTTKALTTGFHLLPTLYGDTVRPAPAITSFYSGVVAAGKGLGLGIYDGVTGLVMKPVRGAKEGGVRECVKGVGRGIGGLVCRPCEGGIGVVGYVLEGVGCEVRRARNRVCTSKSKKGE